MIDSKKAFLAIGMSIVLSSYLLAGSGSCPTNNGKYEVTNILDNWDNGGFKACLYHAYQSGVDATVSFSRDMTITLTSAAEIEGSNHITIDGEGKNIIIDGNNTTNILVDNNSHKITLKDLTLKDGNISEGDGGAALSINTSGDVDIINVSFLDNYNNSYSSSYGGGGGAMYIADKGTSDITVNITDSKFLRNSATEGGAIHVGSSVTLNIDATDFIANNDLNVNGHDNNCAGVYASNNVDISIKNSLFSANKSVNVDGSNNGVAIFTSYNTSLDINNTIFSFHSSDGSSSTALITTLGSQSLTINESEFYDNNISVINAKFYGNAVTINKTIFKDNNVTNSELVEIETKNLTVDSSKFLNNSSQHGILSSFGDSLIVNNSEFDGNTAKICVALLGGGDVTISNTTISNNEAMLASAICALYSSEFKIINSTISGNRTLYDYRNSGTILADDVNLTIESSTIIGNSGDSGTVAGILNSQNNIISLNNTILTNNIVDSQQSNTNIGLNSITFSIVGSDVNATTELNVLKGVDPKLGELKDNGGDTKTCALLSGSPAIDAGYSVIPTDQRGILRKGTPDIGSYEYQGGRPNPAIIMYLLN